MVTFTQAYFETGIPGSVTELIIPRAVGNNITGELKISRLPQLKAIRVAKFTLQNILSVVINDNPRLQSIHFENGNEWNNDKNTGNGCFENAKVLKIYSSSLLFPISRSPFFRHALYWHICFCKC